MESQDSLHIVSSVLAICIFTLFLLPFALHLSFLFVLLCCLFSIATHSSSVFVLPFVLPFCYLLTSFNIFN